MRQVPAVAQHILPSTHSTIRNTNNQEGHMAAVANHKAAGIPTASRDLIDNEMGVDSKVGSVKYLSNLSARRTKLAGDGCS